MTEWPPNYRAFPDLYSRSGNLVLRPIQWQDREAIRQWRNQQISVLRQSKPLSLEDQDRYFLDEVLPQMSAVRPPQLLVGLLERDRLIGYGGLVHLDWAALSAEVSFLTESPRAQGTTLLSDWTAFMGMLVPLAKDVVGLRQLTTETYESRQSLIHHLEDLGFLRSDTPPGTPGSPNSGVAGVRHILPLKGKATL